MDAVVSFSACGLEPEGKQSIHVAAMRRNCQGFEHLEMSLREALVFGLRGHFGSRPRS
jgi:hypothetical protein